VAPLLHSTPSTTSKLCTMRAARRPQSAPEPTTVHDDQPQGDLPMSTRDVTDATFEAEVLKNEKTIMVDFWAEWCGPCRAVSPILDAIASEHSDKLEIVKLNVDQNPETAMKYQITSIPAMKVFRGGEVVKTVIGAKPKPALEADLAEFLA
jgi:thioredoxin 1